MIIKPQGLTVAAILLSIPAFCRYNWKMIKKRSDFITGDYLQLPRSEENGYQLIYPREIITDFRQKGTFSCSLVNL